MPSQRGRARERRALQMLAGARRLLGTLGRNIARPIAQQAIVFSTWLSCHIYSGCGRRLE